MIRVLIGAGEIVLLESREADPDQARGLVVECTLGDIARQGDCDAVVNAANAWLRPGSGVAGALHKARAQNWLRNASLWLLSVLEKG